MSVGKKTLVGLAAIAGVYLGILFLGGVLGSGCAADRLKNRLSRALGAEVTVGDSSVFVASGKATFRDVVIKRDGVDIKIERVDASMPAMGLMIISPRLKTVVVANVVAKLSARGMAALAMKERVAVHIDELLLKNATVSISPTLIIPGLGRVDATIESARSRDVDLASAVSWLSDLDEMVADASVPGGLGGKMSFRGGNLDLSGSWFGGNPLSIPFEFPELSGELLEIDQLKLIGRELIKAVAKHVAKDKLLDAAKSLFD